MRFRDLWLFLLGAAVGGGAVFYVLTEHRTIYFPHAVAGPEKVRVLVAKQPLASGTAIGPQHLKWVEWPRAHVPPGAFTSAEVLLGVNGDQRRIVLRQIEAGAPVLASKITRPGESPQLLKTLGPSQRAVSFRIGAETGVAGFVAPGDRVDVMLTRPAEGRLVSSILLQDVLVLAIDQVNGTETSSPRVARTVTVAVTPEQAEKIVRALESGRLSPLLRSIGAPNRAGPGRRLIRDGRVLTPDDLRGPMPGQITDFPIHPALRPPPDAN